MMVNTTPIEISTRDKNNEVKEVELTQENEALVHLEGIEGEEVSFS